MGRRMLAANPKGYASYSAAAAFRMGDLRKLLGLSALFRDAAQRFNGLHEVNGLHEDKGVVMKRLPILLCSAASMALAAAPAGAAPNIYHTISSTHGSATVTSTSGCEQTEVFVSSSVAMYASQPGPVNKQGLTAVFVRVTDICAAPAGVVTAAAGGDGAVLFQAEGQNMAPLVADPRLSTASVRTDMAGTDGDGNPVTISLSATWTGTGPLEHDTVHTHGNYPDEGNVNATDNNLRRAATADVSVTVDGMTVGGTDPGALLEQVKSRCIEVARPGVEEFFPCFGFPG